MNTFIKYVLILMHLVLSELFLFWPIPKLWFFSIIGKSTDEVCSCLRAFADTATYAFVI